MVEAITKRKKKTPPPVTDLSPYTGTWTRTHATHLLRRATFGAKSADVDAFLKKGLTLSVLELFSGADANPAPPINNYVVERAAFAGKDNDGATVNRAAQSVVDAAVKSGDVWVNAKRDSTVEFNRIQSFKGWWFDLMMNQKRSLREKMTLFLHNLIATETVDVFDGRYAYKHNQLLRTYAYGSYKELIKKVTLDPMMLVYLNGRLNKKTAPDENYARELQELFTVGKGPGSGYTEDDVKAAAKVLTGYEDVSDTLTYSFNSTNHDTTNKQFSAFYGNKVITGKTGVDGQKELDELLDMIFSTQEVAKYICRRIYTFFVYYEITPEVEANIITPLANKFRSSGYNLKSVMETLLSSKHFYDDGIMGAVLKSPVDFTIGILKELEVKPVAYVDTTNDPIEQKNLRWDALIQRISHINNMSTILQNIGDPPNVAGWAAYYQEPQYHEIWVNTDSITKRKTYANDYSTINGVGARTYLNKENMSVMVNGVKVFSTRFAFDSVAFVSKFKTPSNPALLVDEMVQRFLPKPITTEDKLYLKNILLDVSGTIRESYWTELWNNYLKNPTGYKGTVRSKVDLLIRTILQSAEYQLS